MITVTQDAKPLPGATVILVPETVLEKGWVISGGTDSRGIARMFTHGKYEGAPGGKYKVLISKQEHENAEPPKMPMSASDFRPPVPVYDTVDARYKTVKTTPFEIEVNNGKTTASFDVGKAVRKTIPKI